MINKVMRCRGNVNKTNLGEAAENGVLEYDNVVAIITNLV